MMFRTEFQKEISEKEISDAFKTYTNGQIQIQSYPQDLLSIRPQMLNWMIFLCQNLNFKTETLYRGASIYDLYLSKLSIKEVRAMNLNKMKLITIASLSLSTKLEEINCNFIEFFTNYVLNANANEEGFFFTQKDLTKMEFEILKKVNFKTIQTTSYQFLTLFQKICYNNFNNNMNVFTYLVNTSENLLGNTISDNSYLFKTPYEIALMCIQETFNQLSNMNNAISSVIFNVLFRISKFKCDIFNNEENVKKIHYFN